MKKFKYELKTDPIICEHEDFMKDMHQNIIKSYEDKFFEYGYKLKYGLGWYNFIKNEGSLERLPFVNGYGCYFSVGVEKNGEVVCYDKEEGATLGIDFNISSITRFFFHLNVILCDDTDDIIEEMDKLLKIATSL